MKITETPVSVSGNLVFEEEIDMGIDDAARGMIVQSLIDMYPNPYVATLREYASNAYDAHLVAGQTRPVEIVLPSTLSPVLTIQDWGVGMDRAELAVYGQFGASTKRDNNDEIGGFGLGSKSGLAVASQFTVTSIKNGKKNTVAIGRRENGAPRMGLMEEQDTDEPNGTIVNIPTSKEYEYQQAIDEVGVFFGWPEGSVLINGKPPVKTIHDTSIYTPLGDYGWYDTRDSVHSHSSNYNSSWNTSSALVGPLHMRYQYSETVNLGLADDELAALDLKDETYAQLEGQRAILGRIIVKVPNGSVTLLRSRESFIYNSITKQQLAFARQRAIEILMPMIQEEIDALPTKREALLKIESNRKNGLDLEYTYKGEKPEYTVFDTSNDKEVRFVTGCDPKYDPYNDRLRVDRSAYPLKNWATRPESNLTQMRGVQPELRGAADGWHRVLITGTPADTASTTSRSYYGEVVVHKVTKFAGTGVKALARHYGNTADRNMNNMTLFFTSEKTSAFNEWDLATFTETITYAEYEKRIQAHRAAIKAENAAAGVTRQVQKDKTRKLRISMYGGQSSHSEVTIGDLDTSKSYVLLRSTGVSDGTLDDKLIGTLLYKTRYYNSGSIWNLATAAFRFAEVEVLYETKSMTPRDYAAAGLTVRKASEVIEEYIAAQVAKITPEFLQLQESIDTEDCNWIHRAQDVSEFDGIEDAETKAYLTNLWNHRKGERDLELIHFLNNRDVFERTAKLWKLAVPEAPEVKTEKIKYGDRYPLLKTRYTSFEMEDAIEYVNFRDARLADQTEAV